MRKLTEFITFSDNIYNYLRHGYSDTGLDGTVVNRDSLKWPWGHLNSCRQPCWFLKK